MLLNISEKIVSYTHEIHVQMASGEEFSVKRYLSCLQAVELPISPEIAKALTNTNTPEEWKATHEYQN